MMRRTFFILLSAITFSFELSAQNYFFAEKREGEISATSAGKRVIIPEKYKSVSLDINGMQGFLKTLTSQPGLALKGNSSVIELPMPEGGRAKYNIWESPVMDPVLAAKFPGIKTYAGQGIDDPTATIKIDFTELGFHAMVLSDITGNIFIDPYRQLDLRNYIVYYKKDFKDKDPFVEYEIKGSSEVQRRWNR